MNINFQSINFRFDKLTSIYDTQKFLQHASIDSSSHCILNDSTFLNVINDDEGLSKAYFKEHSIFMKSRSNYRFFEKASLENES